MWLLEDRKFLSRDEQDCLRGFVRRRLVRAGLKRSRWLEWFVVELAFETGLRVGEMSSLMCGDLVLDAERAGVLVRCGKGGKARYVRVRKEFCKTAERFLAWKAQVSESVDSEAPVFVSAMTGRRMTVRALQKVFERVCKKAGVEGHSIHHCRHTYATELLRASKGNLRLVQKQLGHAKITTTQVYADVFDEDMGEAVNDLYGKGTR